MFSGTYTALVTPFRNGQVDDSAFEALIEAQIAAGVDGIVPVGTTGESPTLDHDEHAHVIRRTVEIARGRCVVMGGTGSNATAEAVAMTVEAEKVGCNAALLVAPYYNKPSQEGLFRHFGKIAEATKLPLVLYSIPGRCGIEIAVETVQRLAQSYPNIVAIKEAGGACDRVGALRQALPNSFAILSGDDSLTVPFIATGANGVVSVASNVIPREVSAMTKAALDGRLREAITLHDRYFPLYKDLFIEPNPVPVKYVLSLLGRMSPDVRLPLCEMSDANKSRLKETLRRVQIIS